MVKEGALFGIRQTISCVLCGYWTFLQFQRKVSALQKYDFKKRAKRY